MTAVDNARVAATAETISKYEYVNDAVGRRTSVVNTGAAFTGNGNDHHWLWGYNDRSELTTADRNEGTDPDNPGNQMIPGLYDYQYDPIGNRTQTASLVSLSPPTQAVRHYCANELNQYTATGAASGCSTPIEEFTHDADGNLTQDGQFDYTWDGENRLIRVETRLSLGTPSVHDDDDVKLEFTYDYMNRRVQKKSFVWDTGDWELETDLRFVYDRWNVVLVLDDAEDVLTKYTWGLDLSGQRGSPTASGIHGAGGIGGLLAVEETATSGTPKYWFLYDANGNVGQIVENTTNYPLAAHYEYDAYGNVLGTPTGYAAVNPFRFSTKWFDAESGLIQYPYRPYGPRVGRWLSRDPLEEKALLSDHAVRLQASLSALRARRFAHRGSSSSSYHAISHPDSKTSNLYHYVLNAPSIWVDPLGLEILEDPIPIPDGTELMFPLSAYSNACFRVCPKGVKDCRDNLNWKNLSIIPGIDGCAVLKALAGDVCATVKKYVDEAAEVNGCYEQECPLLKTCCFKSKFDGEYPIGVWVNHTVPALCEVSGYVSAVFTFSGWSGGCR